MNWSAVFFMAIFSVCRHSRNHRHGDDRGRDDGVGAAGDVA